MKVPSVKGVMLLPSVVVVRRLRDRGAIPEAELAKLSSAARELLDERIEIAQWYPMDVFSELLEIDWELCGGRDPEYMRQAGERNAEAMTRTKRYQQLDYLERADRPESSSDVLRQMRLTSSITQSYFNFTETTVQMHPDRPNVLQILYANTDAFPESLRYSTEGFMNRLNRVRRSSRKWTSERVGNTIVFSLEMKPRSESTGGGD
jgi:hypothetical protein